MADTSPLTPRDYDPWALATPLQLLTLLERLDISMTEVARWLHVPRSSISMWRHGTREVPPKHIPTLVERTRRTFKGMAELSDKAAQLAPTAELGQALRAEWGALWARWKSEVLAEAGTFERALARAYATMGRIVQQSQYRHADVESVQLIAASMAQYMELIITLKGEAPDPDEVLIARLTAAHAQTVPLQLSTEERAAAEADQPEGP